MGSTVTGCVSISAFASLVGVPVGIASSDIRKVGLTIFAVTPRIQKCKSNIKKKKNKNDKIVLLAKIKLNTIEVWFLKPTYMLIMMNLFQEIIC